MNSIFLIGYILIPIVTCLNISNLKSRVYSQIVMLLILLVSDTYFYYSAQINEVRARRSDGFWPWGKAGITEEALYFGAKWSKDDYLFIDHLAMNHFFYIFVSGLAFYSYIYFFTKIFDHYRNKKLA